MEKNEVGLETVADIVETQDSDGNDTTNWKEIVEGIHKQGRAWEGVAKRNHTDLEKLRQDPRLKPVSEPPIPPKKEITEFDYGQLALLEARGIPEEDHDLLLNEVKTTGKELKQLLGFDYMKETLKKNQEKRTTQNALPAGSGRSAPAANSAEYYFEKLERGDITFGDISDSEIKRKVRHLKEKKSGGSSQVI